MKRTKKTSIVVGTLVLFLTSAGVPAADSVQSVSAPANLPVKEVTIFKDGHAFVMHSGTMPVNPAGHVVLDDLPSPVLGTFWPFSNEEHAKLKAVVAGRKKISAKRTALDMRGLIEANVGRDVIITEHGVGRYHATILGIPTRTSKELQDTNSPGDQEMLPRKGNVVLVRTDEGVKVLDFKRITQITIKGKPNTLQTEEEFRNRLTLHLDWDEKPAREANVGMVYLQRGLRWIPGYKVVIDGKGTAKVKLEASVVNDLADLENVTAHLVIGVPRFVMEGQTDPISLQQTAQQLSQYFRSTNGLSNAISTQVVLRPNARAEKPMSSNESQPGPEVTGSRRNEDLFVFTIKNLTLKKGQRMVLPINEVTLKYRDVYTLNVPFAPPPEVWRNINSSQQMEIARQTARPKVMHQLRITNGKECPLTTAPALIFLKDRVLGQGLMTYTSREGEVDLPITTAVDVKVKKSEKELNRTPNAVTWNSHSYQRIDLTGTLAITNYSEKEIELEIRRFVLGNVTEAGQDGQIEMINLFEDPDFLPGDGGADGWPAWWNWCSWPHWWHYFNGVGKVAWKLKMKPGETKDLTYAWNYYWG
ncbi:MAG: hypothetical protein JXA11_07460 [Phycisphaerae bacterium]|nr:hypothetical protein [Phycisphaerae bacterium]